MVVQQLAWLLFVALFTLVVGEKCTNTVSSSALVNQINLQLNNGQFECDWPKQCCVNNGGTACCIVWYFWVILAVAITFVLCFVVCCCRCLCCSNPNSVEHEPPPAAVVYGHVPEGMAATNAGRKSLF